MFKNIIHGIKAYFGSFQLIFKLKLWKYFGIPVLISLCTGFLFISLIYMYANTLGGFISKAWIWEWGSATFAIISTYIGGLIIILVALIVYKHIIMAFSAPFMSPVSEKIETYLLGDRKHVHRITSFREQLIRGIRINARNLTRELLCMIPLIILSLIPVVGLLFTLLMLIIQAYYAGFGNMDYTMERHFKYKESVQFVRKHKGIAIGNGAVFVLMLFIPIIGFIITLPIAVVAASTATIKIIDQKK